ncbi:MAG: nuclear transport factor 2 family protein [Brumimicrobium sp.]|nr:nuclear transport factor 2 family protein [Brumimicrobium sp.]
MDNSKNNEQIAANWFKAFNEHHLENLLSLYDDNAQHFSPKLKIRQPETKGIIQGKAALHTWWQDAFDRLPDLTYTVLTITANDTRVFMEYIRRVNNEEDLIVAEVLEIENEKIIASRVYHG